MSEAAIKVRKKGDKRWAFLTPGGGTTHLRIHAATFRDEDTAKAVVKASIADNPDYEMKAVKL